MVVMAFQAAQRTANFAVSNPAREVLFTAADREDKYKAKNVVDGVVFRGADVGLGLGLHLAAHHAGLGRSADRGGNDVRLAGLGRLEPFLGRMQEKRARLLQSPSP